MEDMIEVLTYVSRFKPLALEGVPMEELLLFFVTFLGRAHYIHNPYLRSKMVEVGRWGFHEGRVLATWVASNMAVHSMQSMCSGCRGYGKRVVL